MNLPLQAHNYSKHDIVPCRMCGESFVCLCNRATECPCSQVNLNRDESEWISWQTDGECICIACLEKMRGRARQVLNGTPEAEDVADPA